MCSRPVVQLSKGTPRQGMMQVHRSTSLFIRWIRFNTVGALGVGVQLAVLSSLTKGAEINYLVATAAAVEAAVLHNFLWHERYTWRDRTRLTNGVVPGVRRRIVRFHLTNGLLSMVANLLLMRLFAGWLHLSLLLANVLSIIACSLANFAMSHFMVFRQSSGETQLLRRSDRFGRKRKAASSRVDLSSRKAGKITQATSRLAVSFWPRKLSNSRFT